MEQEKKTQRVLIFPLSTQGHVTSMLHLAELLALEGLHVTFLNTHYTHTRLLRHSDAHSRLSRYPGFLFRAITDGLPGGHNRASDAGFMEMIRSMKETAKPILKDMLVSDKLGSEISPSVTCIIADGIFARLVSDIGDELGIPVFLFRTISACCFWPYYFVSQLIQTGELPIRGEEDMDRVITGVPGMERFLRCRDLPSFCRVRDVTDPFLQLISQETQQSSRAKGVIFNTFEDLEGPILSHIRTKCPNTYAIGPLHAHLNTRLISKKVLKDNKPLSLSSPNSLFDVDKSCIAWLDSQPPKSVVYVSFGSVVVMTKENLIEFWYGLVNSNKRFLWAIREDLVTGDHDPDDQIIFLREETRERGYIAGWVPQGEVLAHKAVGGFLTHSGWNSTLESIVAGVPMICWPYFADQQINSRYVSEVWKIGIDMKDICDRRVVEKMVNDLMVDKREAFMASMADISALANKSVDENGSSFRDLDRLVEDIKLGRYENN